MFSIEQNNIYSICNSMHYCTYNKNIPGFKAIINLWKLDFQVIIYTLCGIKYKIDTLNYQCCIIRYGLKWFKIVFYKA